MNIYERIKQNIKESDNMHCRHCNAIIDDIDNCETDQYWTNDGDRIVYHKCPECNEALEELDFDNDNITMESEKEDLTKLSDEELLDSFIELSSVLEVYDDKEQAYVPPDEMLNKVKKELNKRKIDFSDYIIESEVDGIKQLKWLIELLESNKNEQIECYLIAEKLRDILNRLQQNIKESDNSQERIKWLEDALVSVYSYGIRACVLDSIVPGLTYKDSYASLSDEYKELTGKEFNIKDHIVANK